MQRNIVAAGLAIIAMALLVACGGDDEPAFACPKGPEQNQCAGIVKDYEKGPKDAASRAAAASKIAALYAPASQAPQGSTSQPSTAGNPSGNLVMTNLLDGRSENPRAVAGVIPGTQCPLYEDTGIGLTETYKCAVPAGWTVLVFGVHVLNNQTNQGWNNGGFWAFVGPTNVDVTVADGAYSAKPSGDAAYQDYCMRLDQHIRNGWLASNANLPSGWNPKCGRP